MNDIIFAIIVVIAFTNLIILILKFLPQIIGILLFPFFILAFIDKDFWKFYKDSFWN